MLDIHRNEKTIKPIKEKADDYDMELKQKADSLMQNNLQNKKNKYCCPVNFQTVHESFPKPFRIGLRAFFFKKQAS